MEIIRAKHSGFCFGVKRAIDIAEKEIIRGNGEGRTYTCGPIIHNAIVTDDLEKRGIGIIESLDEAKAGDRIIVRSHGEPPEFYEKAKELGISLVDATCPIVSHIHELIKDAHMRGEKVLIVGDKSHPEVISANGWCDYKATILGCKEDAENIVPDSYFLVCQTTIKRELLMEILGVLEEKGCEITVNNTICNATKERQESCEELAKNVDAMVIIGDRNSSNTRKLYEIAKNACETTYFIEKNGDLPLKELKKYNKIGVAAGASSPESVIKEVIANMSENEKITMADFMDEIDASLRLPHNNEIVDGKVHEVTEKEVIVNLGCKKDGILPLEEVTLEEGKKLTDMFKPGDEIQAKVIKTDDGEGSILLSKKRLEVSEHWAEIADAHENRTIINVKVLRTVNGGVIAEYKGVTGFIPMSQLSDRYVEAEEADSFIGQSMDVRVTRVDQRRNRAVFSHKSVLMEERQKAIANVWDNLNVGDVVEGKVMRFTDYGAFVDIGGIDGLLHISEISWGKLKHPQEVLSIGDEIKVKILSMNQEKGKISLGLKQITPEPWTIINDKYQVGEIVTGKVVQLKEYGAFVELEPGLDGLVHISEVAHKRVANISDELALGQEVSAKILEIDTERKRISLSIKAAVDPSEIPEEEEEAEAEAPSEEAPVEEAPAEETVSEEAPVEEVPAEETASEEAPAEEAPAEEEAKEE